MLRSSSVERYRKGERPDLGVLEEVDALREEFGAAKVRLGIETEIRRPRVQVAAAEANQGLTESELLPQPRIVERVRDRHLAPLREVAVLDELRLHGARAAAGVCIPVLPLCRRAERDPPGAGTCHALVGEDVLAEDAGRIRPDRSLFSRAEPVERRERAVPDLGSSAEIEQRGEPVSYTHLTLADERSSVDLGGR